MNDAAIVELLHAGRGERAINRQLGVPRRQIRAIRRTLDIPHGRPGRSPAASPEDLFWRRAVPTDDGHLLWPGAPRNAAIHHAGRHHSAHRVAFRIGNQREPDGIVRTGCAVSGCVHPAHVEDAPMRHQYTAIFGRPA